MRRHKHKKHKTNIDSLTELPTLSLVSVGARGYGEMDTRRRDRQDVEDYYHYDDVVVVRQMKRG